MFGNRNKITKKTPPDVARAIEKGWDREKKMEFNEDIANAMRKADAAGISKKDMRDVLAYSANSLE